MLQATGEQPGLRWQRAGSREQRAASSEQRAACSVRCAVNGVAVEGDVGGVVVLEVEEVVVVVEGRKRKISGRLWKCPSASRVQRSVPVVPILMR